MLESLSLQGRHALVTGASRGIAAAVVAGFARHGADVTIHHSERFDRERGFPEAAADVAASVRALGRRAAVVERDIREPGAATIIVDGAEAALGPVDILVISASMQINQPFEEFTAPEIDAHVAMNFVRTVELLQRVLPGMAERGWGRVLSVGSIQASRPNPMMSIYAATKAAQANLINNLAKTYALRGVTLNSISPGLVETDRNAFRRVDPASWRRLAEACCPMRRAGQPEDMQGAAVLLCSDAGAYITGAEILITGGGHL